MDEKPKVHPESFTPRSVGRTPIVDINGLIAEAARHEGLWISKVYTNREASSVMGQLKRRGYDCSSNVVDADHREVYVKYVASNG